MSTDSDEARASALFRIGEAVKWLSDYVPSPNGQRYDWGAEELERAATFARKAAQLVRDEANDIAAAAVVAPVAIAAE